MVTPSTPLRLVRPDEAPPEEGPGEPEPPDQPSEEPEEQPRSAGAGPVGNFDDAFRRYVPYVGRIAYRILGRENDVDDLIQDVFMEAYRRWDAIRDAEAVKGWLGVLTVRMAKKRLERRRRRSFLWRRDTTEEPLFLKPEASPEEQALLSQVFRVLERLPADQRIAWTLRHLEGAKVDEVATLCGCSRATAKRRIAAAHAVLNEAIYDG